MNRTLPAAGAEVTPRTTAMRRPHVRLRRLVFIALVLASVALGIDRMAGLLATNGWSELEMACLGLFTLLAFPLAISFWIAVCGVFVRVMRGDPLEVTETIAGIREDEPLRVRSAIVVPVHNEDPQRVAAGIRATYDSLERTGHLGSFDFHVLSDTTDPDVWVDEEVVYAELREDLSDRNRLHYRKRAKNTEQKAGNIAEFCASHGDRYRYMIVFDADSVMRGRTLVDLVRLMERHPTAGIIQAPPVPANKNTLFGRIEQFSARVYGPLFQAGLSFVQGGEGNYYGHNAIIRLKPFREHCRLPRLSGNGPLSGNIMSHDFVEAAFMRRAGYSVHLAVELAGSYEEPPPTLVDSAARDRRWCQGNLQHARLLFLPGLNFVSRVHLLMGIMAFVSSPLWILLLLLSTAQAVHEHVVGHSYFDPTVSLFPIWPISTTFDNAVMFGAVMAVLFAPKAFAAAVVWFDAVRVERFGGRVGLAASVLLESLASMLLAPVRAVLQTQFVVLTLLGRRVRWTAQERDDVGTPFLTAVSRHWGTTVLGVAWALIAWNFAHDLFWWLLPVTAGMASSILISWFTSRVGPGLGARSMHLFVTPEETNPLFLLRRLREENARRHQNDGTPPRDGLVRVLDDPTARAVHLANLPKESDAVDPLARHQIDGLALRFRLGGPQALSKAEKHELLLSRRAIDSLAGSSRAAEPPPAHTAGAAAL